MLREHLDVIAEQIGIFFIVVGAYELAGLWAALVLIGIDIILLAFANFHDS